MMDQERIQQVVAEVLANLGYVQCSSGSPTPPGVDGTSGPGMTMATFPQSQPTSISQAQTWGGPEPQNIRSQESAEQSLSETAAGEELDGDMDLTGPVARATLGLESPLDRDAILRMGKQTNARIGVGRAGPRLRTRTLLTLRADHAAARDGVFRDVDQQMLDRLGLFTIQTQCGDKDTFLTRPDLGRKFGQDALETLRAHSQSHPDILIYASDGLSSTAVNANLPHILPVMMDTLRGSGLTLGTPFFVKYGRVPAMDVISETLSAKVVCTLIGERPGLATAESMSAYITYNGRVGMAEANRTVVSNIHGGGTPAIEAGAYIAELLLKIYAAKASGVALNQGAG